MPPHSAKVTGLPSVLTCRLVFPALNRNPSFQKLFLCLKKIEQKKLYNYIYFQIAHISLLVAEPHTNQKKKTSGLLVFATLSRPDLGGLTVLRSLPPCSWLFQGPWPSQCDAGFGPRSTRRFIHRGAFLVPNLPGFLTCLGSLFLWDFK